MLFGFAVLSLYLALHPQGQLNPECFAVSVALAVLGVVFLKTANVLPALFNPLFFRRN